MFDFDAFKSKIKFMAYMPVFGCNSLLPLPSKSPVRFSNKSPGQGPGVTLIFGHGFIACRACFKTDCTPSFYWICLNHCGLNADK